MEHLDLAANQLEDIEEGVFDHPKLKILKLQFNKLTVLPNGLFTGVTALIDLDLYDNQIERVNNALHPLTHLEVLELSKNKISDFDLKNAATFPELTSLDLSQNGIDLDAVSISPVDISATKSKLKTLSFGDNPIRSGILFDKLKLFPKLESVSLGRNSMKQVDLDAIQTTGLPKLTTVYFYPNDKDLDLEWLKTKTQELSMNLDLYYMKITIRN